jgi:hypothetical protein
MCHVSAGKQVSQVNTLCDCVCGCPVTLPVGEEIRRLEEHKKILEDEITIIDKKIAGQKTVNGS